MTKLAEFHLSEFLRVTKKSYSSSDNTNPRKLHVDFDVDTQIRIEVMHDLAGAVNTFKAMIELSQAAVTSFDERQQKKFQQLNAHLKRLEDLVAFVDDLTADEDL